MPLTCLIGLETQVVDGATGSRMVTMLPSPRPALCANTFDIGDLEVSYSPDDHTGLDFADLSIVGTDGKFKR